MIKIAAYAFYKSKRWQKLREFIVNTRDNGICAYCGQKGDVCHHKVFVTAETVNDPNVVFNPDNLITLCQDCHNRLHHSNPDNSATWPELGFDKDGNLIQIEKKVEV